MFRKYQNPTDLDTNRHANRIQYYEKGIPELKRVILLSKWVKIGKLDKILSSL